MNLDEQPVHTAALTTPSDRRVSFRHHWRLDDPYPLTVCQRQESRWVRIKDISTNGICVLVACALKPGTTALLRLRGGRGFTPVELMLQVVHATAQADGNWAVGCKIDDPHNGLDDSECVRLQEVFEPTVGSEEEGQHFSSVPEAAYAWSMGNTTNLGVCC